MTSGANVYPPNRKVCKDCGRFYYSWGKHAEECVGPPSEPECDCGPGWLHDPFCHLVTGKKRT